MVHHVHLTRARAGAGVEEMGRGDEEAVAAEPVFVLSRTLPYIP